MDLKVFITKTVIFVNLPGDRWRLDLLSWSIYNTYKYCIICCSPKAIIMLHANYTSIKNNQWSKSTSIKRQKLLERLRIQDPTMGSLQGNTDLVGLGCEKPVNFYAFIVNKRKWKLKLTPSVYLSVLPQFPSYNQKGTTHPFWIKERSL